ncbi:MAG: DUF4412 domain-containing protein [Alphaproteobacteria bacterium]
MKPLRLLIAAIFLAVPLAVPMASASAQDIWSTKASYSADRKIDTQGLPPASAKVYVTPEAERWEMLVEGRKSVMLFRKDRKQVFVLLDDQRKYIEIPAEQSELPGVKPEGDVQLTAAGNETIEGIPTTKYRMTVQSNTSGRFEGFVWVSADNILMKMDGVGGAEGQTAKIAVIMQNVRVSPQDPKLFEIPQGYTKLDPPKQQ